ncbi:hypothetical protein PRIEUP_LOCUS16558 [Pristimantis euphronides]
MAWYQRMGINVPPIDPGGEWHISGVESRLVICDPAAEGYHDRNLKSDAWLGVATSMYPDWDNATAKEQDSIVKDLCNHWRNSA